MTEAISPQHIVHEVDDPHELIKVTLEHLDHVLPAQAPIQDFVHHNTLHGFQHLPFDEALSEAEKLTGIRAYLPEQQFRVYFEEGRIDESDLTAALAKQQGLNSDEIILALAGNSISRNAINRIALLFDLDGITPSELNWQIEELDALDKIQPDIPEYIHARYSSIAKSKTLAIRPLWVAICAKLEFGNATLHPEQLLDMNLLRTETWLADHQDTHAEHLRTRQLASDSLKTFFADVSVKMTLRDAVCVLSGTDVLDSIRPQIISLCASVLDEGLAAWQLPERGRLGLYASWRSLASYDIFPFLHEMADYANVMAGLPDEAADCIIMQLHYFGISQEHWLDYLTRLALEIPGWAGMINWRQQHPKYVTINNPVLQLADYLAIRLVMDRLWLNQVCRETWKVDANLNALKGYFEKNLSEFIVRRQLYTAQLPEYLTREAEALVVRAGSERQCRHDWQHLADLISIWQVSSIAEKSAMTSYNAGWRIFRLAQHLGLTVEDIGLMGKADLQKLLAVVDEFSAEERRKIWLLAYERHYQQEFLGALQANQKRGRWARRENRPSSQLIFCMDDREESFRRHLEELDASIETLGAAGFFGVAVNYQGLDDIKTNALCPVVVVPVHNVKERTKAGAEPDFNRHQNGRKINQGLDQLIHHSLRSSPLVAYLSIILGAPLALLGLLAKTFFPMPQRRLMALLGKITAVNVQTELAYVAEDSQIEASSAQPRLGFTNAEQIDRVAGLLRNTGLTYGFAPLVVLMGHGSISQNNPHLAAYDCGACSGRHGGANARLFAAMANRPEVRRGLAERDIFIPDDTWFIGAEHNTCSEDIDWFDLADLPQHKTKELQNLQQYLTGAQQLSAHERCRRLASAPSNPELDEALDHIQERATDFSQARPELGHATNAAAVVGRRSVTQGAFFDRRVFLISYDYTQDPDGKILESILLAVGPVGAGINLEYYFSTVNNERFGCGTKIPHNVVGLFAVMEGTSSDLRTGLPRQMIEIHEAMRLQLLVEAKKNVLEDIYARQPSLRELIAGNWLYLSVIDPDDGAIHIFESGLGFVPWKNETSKEPQVFANSRACYGGSSAPVSPALIEQPE